MNRYEGSRNGRIAFVQNGEGPPYFPFEISRKGIGNELCDWWILLLALPIPIKKFTLDRKRRNRDGMGRKRKPSDPCDSDSDSVELTIAISSPFFIHTGTEGSLRF